MHNSNTDVPAMNGSKLATVHFSTFRAYARKLSGDKAVVTLYANALDAIATAGLDAPQWMVKDFDKLGGDKALDTPVTPAAAPAAKTGGMFDDVVFGAQSAFVSMKDMAPEAREAKVTSMTEAFALIMAATTPTAMLDEVENAVRQHSAYDLLHIGGGNYWHAYMEKVVEKGAYFGTLPVTLEKAYERFMMFMIRFGQAKASYPKCSIETPHFHKVWVRPGDDVTHLEIAGKTVDVDKESGGWNHNLNTPEEFMEWIREQHDFAGLTYENKLACSYWWKTNREEVAQVLADTLSDDLAERLDTPPTESVIKDIVKKSGEEAGRRTMATYHKRLAIRRGLRPDAHPLAILGTMSNIKATAGKQLYWDMLHAERAVKYLSSQRGRALFTVSDSSLEGSLADPDAAPYAGGFDPYESFDRDWPRMSVGGIPTLMPKGNNAEWAEQLAHKEHREEDILESLTAAMEEAKANFVALVDTLDSQFKYLTDAVGWPCLSFKWTMEDDVSRQCFSYREAAVEWAADSDLYREYAKLSQVEKARKHYELEKPAFIFVPEDE